MRRPHSLRFTLLLLAFLAFASADFEDIVTNINSVSTSPNQVGDSWKQTSIEGGAYLYIKGSGFSTRSASSNRVTIGDVPCPIIEFLTTSTQIVCVIPPSEEGEKSATIRVFVDNLRIATCPTCWVYYSYWRTPQIKYVIPNAANPGKEIYYYGRQRVGSSTDLDYFKIGEDRCDATDQNEFTSISFNANSDQSAPCNIPKLEAGYYSISQKNKQNTGSAQKLNSIPTYRFNGEPYDFSIVPQINSISNNVGSAEGQIITIQGTGFSTSGDNQVNLAGTPCEILSESSTEIQCELASRSTPIITQGYHSGLKLEVFPKQSIASVKAGTAGSPSITKSNLVFELPLGLGNTFSSKLSGYFRAPTTGNYKFIVSADDLAQLYISRNPADTTNTQLLVNLGSSTPYKFFFTKGQSQISEEVPLTEGEFYYLELYHQQYSGSSYATVGVQIPNTPNTVNNRPEVQSVRIECPVDYEIVEFKIKNAVEGAWRIRFDYLSADGKKIERSATTANLTIDATAADISSAISSTMSIGSEVEIVMLDAAEAETTEVTEAVTFIYKVTFKNLRKNGRLPVIESSDLVGTDVAVSVAQTQEPSPALSGAFSITRSGETAEFTSNIQSWDFESNLRTVGFQDPIQVARYGDADLGAEWIIQFDGDGSTAIEALVIANSLTGCKNPSEIIIHVTTLQESSNDLVYTTIPAELLFTASPDSQITLTSNGVRANCPNFNCDYVLQTANLPEIASASFSAPTLVLTVENIGTSNAQDVQVFLGNSECQISALDDSSSPATIIAACEAPEAGSFTPRIHINNLGYAAVSSSVTPLDIDLTINSISPSQVNPNGGTTFTVSGSGFPASLEAAQARGLALTIGTGSCTLKTVTSTQITCVNTAVSAAAPLIAALNGKSGSSTTLSLLTSIPTISTVTPNSANPVLQTDITIAGTNFDSSSAQTSVFLKNTATSKIAECLVSGSTTTQISCKLLGAPTGTYQIFAQTSKGYTNSQPFTVQTVITSISPSSGSVAGGTLLTIQGGAFSNEIKQTLVFIGDDNIACDVVSSTSTQVQCTTRALEKTINSGAAQTVYVDTRIVEEAVCQDSANNCQFTYSDALTPQITALSASSVAPGASFQVTGSGLTGSTVTIDGVSATVTSNTDSQVVFTVPASAAPNTAAVLVVNVAGKGNAQFDSSLKSTISVTPAISNVSPTIASNAGALLTITGAGFRTGASVLVGTKACEIRSLTSTTITCKATNAGEISLSYGDFTGIKCSGACSLSLAAAQTPAVSSVSPLAPALATAFTLTIQGTQLNIGTPIVTLRSTADQSVAFTGVSSSITATQLSASFTNVAGGSYTVELASGANIASGSYTVVVPLTATVSSAVQSSLAGGATLTISGTGFFGNAQANRNKVTVCGFLCQVVSSSASSIQCKTPLFVNSAVLADYPNVVTSAALTPSSTWSDSATEAAVFDKAFTTIYKSSKTADCIIGFDIGAGLQAHVSEILFHPDPSITSSKLAGTVIEGSNDNITFTTVTTLDANSHDGWNTITLDTAAEYRFYRVRGADSTAKCALAELQYKGVVLSSSTTSDLDAISCTATVTTNDKSIETSATAVNYKETSTPVVASLSDSFGTSAGGEPLTLYGSNFGTVQANTKVYIDDVECTVNTVSNTQIACTTGPAPAIVDRKSSLESKLRVEISDKGSAIVNSLQYLYIDRWSDESTWGGITPPREGDSVSIPAGQTILLDVSPPKLKAIIIEGALIFDDANINLDVEYIMINNGRLQIGTPDEPIQNKITVTLHGKKESEQLPTFGNKVIAVMEGILDIHGKPRSHTWTVLDATAAAGATSITVQENVDWAVGEQIVIASTEHDHYQSESRYITSVTAGSGKTTLSFTEPLVNRHYAGVQTIDGTDFEMRAEVGLLSRNVVIQGDDQSQKLQYGAHIMAHSHTGDDSSIVRISYTEVRQAGQAFNLGRYPIHLHLIGNVRQSYVLGNAVHHTYNRAITIHGVHFFRVQKNVAYWTMGHSIFIEDGIETHNVIEDNLVINTMASTALLETDQTPASFWITNPNNIWRRNRAAGSDRYGFWFDLRAHPEGPSATDSICPIGERLGEFIDNQAHSSGRYGLRVFHELTPRKYPCQPITPFEDNPPVPAEFTNFLGWKNFRSAIIGERLGAIKFKNIWAADNLRCGIEISFGDLSPADTLLVEDAWIVGTSPENGGDVTQYTSREVKGLITPRVDNFLARRVSFSNFPAGTMAIGTCSHCEHPASTDAGARTSFFEDLTFNNVVQRVKFNIPYKEILVDRDGSLTDNTAGGKGVVTFFYNHLNVPGCTENQAVYNGLVCDHTQDIRKVEILGLNPFDSFSMHNLDLDNIENTQDTELGSIPYRSMKQSWAVPFVTGYSYQLSWKSRADFNALTVSPSALYTETDKAITLIFNHTDYRETFDIYRAGNSTALPNITTLWDAVGADSQDSGDWHHDVENQLLYLAVNGKEKKDISVRAVKCRVNCPIVSGSVPKDGIIRLWSDATIWPEGVVPQDGDDVIIPGEWTIRLDVDSAKLGTLEVRGDLYFDETQADLTLTAERIWVTGQFFIGNSTEQRYQNQAKILLTGARKSKTLVMGPVQDAGNKVLAVTGNLTMYGAEVNNIYVRLQASAQAGDTTITVPTDVDWKAGDLIVLAPSQRNPTEFETRTIQSISNGVITLDTPLKYFHFGASATTKETTYGTLDMRTEVGLLTRNIKVEGSDEDSWGGRIYVGEVYNTTLDYFFRGRIDLDGIECINLGQANTTFAGLTFDVLSTDNNLNSYVANSVLRNSLGYSINIIKSTGIYIDSNIIFYSFKYQVRFDGVSSDITYTNNLNIGNKDRGIKADAGDNAVDLTAMLYADKALTKSQISGNIFAGCEKNCIIIKGGACSTQPQGPYTFNNNVAHSGETGLLADAPDAVCNAITHFTAYKLEIGVTTFFKSKELRASNLIVADSHIGVALQTGGITEEVSISLKNSHIFGLALATSDPSAYWNKTECTDLAGSLIAVSTTGGKSIPPTSSQLPWYKIKSDHIWKSTYTVSGVTFENFDNSLVSECSGNRALYTNPYASDSSASTKISNINNINVGTNNRVFFENPNDDWIGIDDCGGWYCTGIKNVVVQDLDGTFFGQISSAVPLNKGVFNNKCSISLTENAYICPESNWGVLNFESMDADALTRILSPINVTTTDGFRNDINNYMDHLWDGFYTSLKRLSRYHSVVETGRDYLVKFTSTVPNALRWQLEGTSSASQSVTAKWAYTTPQSVKVTDDAGKVYNPKYIQAADDTTGIAPEDGCGSNVYSVKERTVVLKLTGEDTCKIQVKLINAIQASIRYSVTIEEFFAQNGPATFIDKVAAVLNINPASIRITEIRSGSTIMLFDVEADYQDNTKASDAAAKKQLEGWVAKLKKAASSGELSILDSKILNSSFETNLIREKEAEEKSKDTKKTIIIVTCSVGFVAILVGSFFLYKRLAAQKQYRTRVATEKHVKEFMKSKDLFINTDSPNLAHSKAGYGDVSRAQMLEHSPGQPMSTLPDIQSSPGETPLPLINRLDADSKKSSILLRPVSGELESPNVSSRGFLRNKQTKLANKKKTEKNVEEVMFNS